MINNTEIKTNKIPAILPISVNSDYGYLDCERLKILLFSLQKCQAHNWLDHLYIITPDSQKKLLKKKCKHIDFIKITVFAEEELFPEFKGFKYWAYRKQMLIKIGAAQLVESDFFLTLDSDIICLQKITPEQLIVEGKALLNYEDKKLHPDWWQASAEVLSAPLDYSSPGMGVTPAILSRTICQYIIEEIENKFQQNWISFLLGIKKDLFWTEYSLYFLCAQKRNCLTHYHLDPLDTRNIQIIDENYTIWFPKEIETLQTNQSLLPSGLFAVLQSSSQISLETILNYLSNMLRISDDDQQLLELRAELLSV